MLMCTEERISIDDKWEIKQIVCVEYLQFVYSRRTATYKIKPIFNYINKLAGYIEIDVFWILEWDDY